MRILYVENHPHFAKAVIAKFLADHEVDVVTSISAAKEACEQKDFDLALVDYDLDDGKGDEFILYLGSNNIKIPVVACSSHDRGNSSLAQAGASATCSKMEFQNISKVIERVFM